MMLAIIVVIMTWIGWKAIVKWKWTPEKRQFSYIVQSLQENQVLVNLDASESLPSSSSAVEEKYDVFLSFRGPDTRKGITSALYDRLQRKGIKTFMDDRDLEVGDVISPTLLAAIKEARFAIVILSQNYASSTWCLEELREICLSMEDNSRILPLFYHVDPADVRHQKESFEKAFSKHETSERHKLEKVKEWRAALNKVANISGWNTNDHKTHKDLVDLIVEFVSRKVVPAAIKPTKEFEEFQATRIAMDEVLKALKDDEINVVGVYGMGGVGKTTMVKHVGAQACKTGIFHHVVMAVVSQNPDFRKIQIALAEQLGFKLDEKTDIGRIARLNKEIMRTEELLIILDDVWGRIELSKIGIPCYDELQKCKSKLLLTTRRLNVFHTMESQANIHLNILSEEDAWNLFLRKARKSFETSTEFYVVARKVARECAGLPVALIAVARALGDKGFEDWKEAARRLEISQPANLDEEKDVFECIKLSYDYLHSDDAKSCFLLCCLFPEDNDIQIEDLMRYGFGTGLFRDVNNTIENARVVANSVTGYLKASCLLLESEKEGCVRMHDVVRDMAISIAQSVDGHASLVKTRCCLKDWSMNVLEGYSAISLIESEVWKLPDKLVCSKLKILLLQGNSLIRKIPKTSSRSPSDLRVLDIKRTGISSLPPSFSLLTNLQALHLDYCQHIDISILGKLLKLEILSMRYCWIKKFPKKIGNLTNLKMLDMTGNRLETFPSQVLSRLSRLEELYMGWSFHDWGRLKWLPLRHKSAGFDELTGLSRLNTLEVSVYEECLAQTLEFNPTWVHFNICISRFQYRWWDTNWRIPYSPYHPSRLLTLHNTTIKNLPDWFICVVTEKAQALWYTDHHGSLNLFEEHDRGRLHGLKFLSITGYSVQLMNTGWPGVSRLSDDEPVYENLEELRISSLDRLWACELPPGSLRNLKILNVGSCYGPEKLLLPSKLLQILHSLETLVCCDTERKKYVFEFEGEEPQRVVLTKLRVISFTQMACVKDIWIGPAPPGIFNSLKIFYLVTCPKLKFLFTSYVVRCLLQLEDLWVEHCSRLDRLIEASEETESKRIILPKLKNLVLKDLPNFTRLCSTSSGTIDIEIGCPSLEQLFVDNCSQFPVSASHFNSRNQVQLNDHRHFDTLQKRIHKESELSNFPLTYME